MKFSELFRQFLNTGKKPTTAHGTSALLDESRAALLDITRRVGTGEIAITSDTTDPAASITPEALQRANKARAAQGRPPLDAVEPSVIHSKTNELRTLQGRPPLKSGMQTSGRPHPIFNPAPKPAAAKPAAPAASKPAAATPHHAASKPTAPATNKFAGAAVGIVVQAATHRSSPEADRNEALAELAARDVKLNPNGTVAFSVRGGRAAKLASKK